MEALEIILLVVAYTALIISLVLQVICYKRNLEEKETMVFTTSLLLLIIALTSSYFFSSEGGEPHLGVLFAMTLVSYTTPINIFKERNIEVAKHIKIGLISISGFVVLLTVLAHFIDFLHYARIVVTVFLICSVAGSMILIRNTEPTIRMKHRERIERRMALTFVIVIPLTLAVNYYAETHHIPIHIGFTLPTVFTILAISKIYDDANRLSLFASEIASSEDKLERYMLTSREKDVALLLIKGKTYKEIGDELFVSIPTVKTHSTNIYKKCKVKSKPELIALFSKN